MHPAHSHFDRVLVAVICGLAASAALADWNPGDPHKMQNVFLPDLSEFGVDMNASDDGGSGRYILFDDFYCGETGPITDIHLWGSWKNDVLPGGSADNVTFILSLHENNNGEPDLSNGWVKTFAPGEFTSRVYASGLQEGWNEPSSGDYAFPGDTVCWQYNFQIDAADAFVQQYDEHYWLNVTAIPTEDDTYWGWKTTPITSPERGHNARWTYESSPWDDVHEPMSSGNMMSYPDGHPYGPPNGYDWWNAEPVNFAFVITPDPATLGMLMLGSLALLRRRG